jgi:ribosomal protein S18 acetylase RimI-like enzyme
MEPTIRLASNQDLTAIERVVHDAYKGYIPLIGKPPAPMTDDYRRRIEAGNVWVLLLGEQVFGLVVLVRQRDHMLLDNVAVAPEKQGCGLGRALMDFAEAKVRECGYNEIRLYTNELMPRNLALYGRLGYEETARQLDSGFTRVFMKKILGPSVVEDAAGR